MAVVAVFEIDLLSPPSGDGRRYAPRPMKYIIVLLIAILAFFVGRYSASQVETKLPEVPVAFVQALHPVSLTIEVDLDSEPEKSSGSPAVNQLHGSATYRFTNISDNPVNVAFPPARTFQISKHQLDKTERTCPIPLAERQNVHIPPGKSVIFSGHWESTVIGDLDDRLQPGAGWSAFTFRSPYNADSGTEYYNDTIIGFQSFNYASRRPQITAAKRHQEFVTSCTPLAESGRTRP